MHYSAAGAPTARWVPGEQYSEALMMLFDQVQGPQDSIDILHFNFFTENGEVRRIANKLKALKKKWPTLPIRIFLEGEKDENKPKGVAVRNRLTQKFFEGTGIEVHFITGLRANSGGAPLAGVNHAKAIRVGTHLLSGSTNLTNTSITKNNEINLLVKSSAIATKFGEFLARLQGDSTRLFELKETDGPIRLMTDTLFFDSAIRLIGEAQSGDTLDLTTYFFAYRSEKDLEAKQIFDALLAAFDRGVQVRVFLEQNNNPAVNPSITQANMGVVEKLKAHGLRTIYLDPNEKISHSKIIRLAGPKKKAALMGSTNLYRGDFSENHQINFLVEDPAMIEELGAYLNQKFAYEGVRQTPTAPMFRFWRGFRQPDADIASVQEKLNASLVPETTAVGAQRGLLAYLPVLYDPATKPALVPDETALIAYENEESYNAIRTTPRGAAYGPLHFQPGLFAQTLPDGRRSTSAVVQPYVGEVKAGSAYLISSEPGHHPDWQKGQVVYRTLMRAPGFDPKAYLDRLVEDQAQIGFQVAIVLVDEGYLLEMLRFETTAAAQAGVRALAATKPAGYSVSSTMTLESQAAGATQLGLGKGINVQFKTELLPPEELLAPLLKPFSREDSGTPMSCVEALTQK